MPQRRDDIEQLFEAALERPPADRAAYLADACADAALRAEVAALLAAHERADGILEADVTVMLLPDVEPPATPEFARALGDRYTIERELGRGGMATVYLAHDLRHERPVALKVLHPEFAAVLGPARFLREIKLTARLQHPHILPVFDSGEAAERIWYAMPYVEDASLREWLRRDRVLPIEAAIQITREVAGALAYAHGRGIVHRDVKPENILLAGGHAFVADFGVAHVAADAGPRLTTAGLVVGTPAYMSPEQATGDPVDARSDLYSLGCVLYEMLTGAPPFTAPSGYTALRQRLQQPAPPARLHRAEIPPAVEAALARALARDPNDRFTTTAEFAAALVESPVAPRGPSRAG